MQTESDTRLTSQRIKQLADRMDMKHTMRIGLKGTQSIVVFPKKDISMVDLEAFYEAMWLVIPDDFYGKIETELTTRDFSSGRPT